MQRDLQRYRGRIVDIVYLDHKGQFTRRMVQLHGVKGDKVKVFCLERQAPRILKIENILVMQPVIGRVV